MEKNLFFIDAETDGLYGGFLTAAILVADSSGRELEHHYLGIRRENMTVTNPWVQEHVVPILGDYTPVEDEAALLEAVWQIWLRHRETAYAIGNVISPVEARLFARCVERDPEARMFLAPFPLLDLASVLFGLGLDPLSDPIPESAALTHNALADIRHDLEILRKVKKRNG